MKESKEKEESQTLARSSMLASFEESLTKDNLVNGSCFSSKGTGFRNRYMCLNANRLSIYW